jgi:hypothetical protein
MENDLTHLTISTNRGKGHSTSGSRPSRPQTSRASKVSKRKDSSISGSVSYRHINPSHQDDFNYNRIHEERFNPELMMQQESPTLFTPGQFGSDTSFSYYQGGPETSLPPYYAGFNENEEYSNIIRGAASRLNYPPFEGLSIQEQQFGGGVPQNYHIHQFSSNSIPTLSPEQSFQPALADSYGRFYNFDSASFSNVPVPADNQRGGAANNVSDHHSSSNHHSHGEFPENMGQGHTEVALLGVDMNRPAGLPDDFPDVFTPCPAHLQYVPPWEYVLSAKDYKASIYAEDFDVYLSLDNEHRAVVVDEIQSVRPFKKSSIQDFLVNYLKPRQAEDLIWRDEVYIDKAAMSNTIKELTKIYNKRRPASREKSWMDGFDDDQRRLVILKLAEATRRAADDLRILFLGMQDAHHANTIAKYILNAKSLEDVRYLAKFYFLRVATKHNWMEGMSKVQVDALRERVFLAGGCGKYNYTELLRRTKKAPPGYGLFMLRNKHNFADIMYTLRTTKVPLYPMPLERDETDSE